MSIPDDRLREHLAVGKESWSAMRSLTASEVYEAVTELLALRHQSSEGWQDISTARKVPDETVLLRIEHVNYAIASGEDKHRWEEIVSAYWTDFNTGGWVWHGLAGTPTHWCPIVSPTTSDGDAVTPFPPTEQNGGSATSAVPSHASDGDKPS